MVFFHVLKEALVLHGKNRSLFLSLYAVIAAAFAVLLAWHVFGIAPLLLELEVTYFSNLPIPPGVLLKLGLSGGFFLIFFFFVGSLLIVATLYSAAATLAGDVTLTLAEVFAAAKPKLKGPLITVALFFIVYFVYGFILSGLITLANCLGGFWKVLFWIFAILFFFKYLFTWVVLAVGVAVSVDEEGKYGIDAFKHAWGIVHPKKFSAFALAFFFFLVYCAVAPIYIKGITSAYLDHTFIVAVILILLYLVIAAWVFVYVYTAITVFFLICAGKREAGEIYNRLAAGPEA